MKKYLKYVIAVIMVGSCGIWFLPVIVIGEQQLSLLESSIKPPTFDYPNIEVLKVL